MADKRKSGERLTPAERDEAEKRILACYPTPLALVFASLLDAEQNPPKVHRRFESDFVPMVLRFVASTLLANCQHAAELLSASNLGPPSLRLSEN